MTDLDLDGWRALITALGERSPDRRALAAREIERTDRPAIAADWEPLTAAQVAVELARVFPAMSDVHRRERSAIIAEALADADPLKRSPVGDVAQALTLSPVSARREIAAHRAASAQAEAVSAQALGERTSVNAR